MTRSESETASEVGVTQSECETVSRLDSGTALEVGVTQSECETVTQLECDAVTRSVRGQPGAYHPKKNGATRRRPRKGSACSRV